MSQADKILKIFESDLHHDKHYVYQPEYDIIHAGPFNSKEEAIHAAKKVPVSNPDDISVQTGRDIMHDRHYHNEE